MLKASLHGVEKIEVIKTRYYNLFNSSSSVFVQSNNNGTNTELFKQCETKRENCAFSFVGRAGAPADMKINEKPGLRNPGIIHTYDTQHHA
jgi:hypothetical protein